MGTFANSKDPDELQQELKMQHFIKICNVYLLDKTISGTELCIYLKILTSDL